MSKDPNALIEPDLATREGRAIFRGRVLREEGRRLESGRESLRRFAIYVQKDYEDVHHTRILCSELQGWAFGDVPRLMIWAPPQTSKSQHSSRLLPAFILGKNPNARILIVSYGADLAESFGQDIQSFIESAEYQSLFPSVKLATGSDKERRTKSRFDIVGFRGGVECVGRGGSITGKGFDYIILDDTIKDMAEAESPTYRETTYNFYRGTLRTRRRSHKTRILMLNTRWHMDDLNGRVLTDAKQNPKADQWKVVNLKMSLNDYEPEDREANAWKYSPGQASEKEVLWPERFPFEDVETTKASNGLYVYSAQYAGDPRSREGNAIKRVWYEPHVMRFIPEEIVGLRLAYDIAYTDDVKGDWTWGSLKAKMRDDSLLTLWMHFGHWTNKPRRENIAEMGLRVAEMAKELCPDVKWKLTEEAGIGPGVLLVKDDINFLIGKGLPASSVDSGKGAKPVRAVAYLGACEFGRTKFYAGGQLEKYGMKNGTNEWINPFFNIVTPLYYSDDGLEFKGGKDDPIDSEVMAHEGLCSRPASSGRSFLTDDSY